MIDKSRRGFDPCKDLTEVDQIGYIDLATAYANGVVSGDANPDQLTFNQIEDPASILGRPADEFDAIRMRDYVVKNGQVPEQGKAD